MVDYNTRDLANILGGSIKKTNEISQDFIPTEEVTDYNIVALQNVSVTGTHKETKKYVIDCDVSGVNGGLDPFVLNHPVNGNLDSSSFYIDGSYCSSTVVFDDTT